MRARHQAGANSCNRRAGARQGRHHAGASRQQTRSCDGLRRRLEPRDRAEEAAARQQPRRSAAAQCAMCGPGGPVRREGCFQDGSLGARGTERAACDAAAPSFGTTAKRPLLLRDTRRRDALVAAKATAAAVAARLNVGSAASPQPSRRLPCPGQAAEQAVPAAEADQRDGLERAPPPPGAAPAKEPAKAGAIGEAVALAPAVLQMFTLRPLSGSAGNVLTVPYPQKCSDSVLTAF
mmetsp:Transcript_27545/g.90314  ORF Transcript_27545/g.90314 Transcript_27545/m.90314 type:complete len:236 (+) Transcript_27545:31-738(+)